MKSLEGNARELGAVDVGKIMKIMERLKEYGIKPQRYDLLSPWDKTNIKIKQKNSYNPFESSEIILSNLLLLED